MTKKLCKVKKGAMISGVCMGISEYFHIQVSTVRMIFILLAVFTRLLPCVLIYALLSYVLPEKSKIGYEDYDIK